MSVGLFVALIALVITFLLGGASGYVIKALSVPASIGTQDLTNSQSAPRNGGPGGQPGDDPQTYPQRTILPNRT
jgi:hypothetical protein